MDQIVQPRPVTSKYLAYLVQWTRNAEMFRSSPEGQAFADEMREVIRLAQHGLEAEIAPAERHGQLQP